jgi:hypothetical protein
MFHPVRSTHDIPLKLNLDVGIHEDAVCIVKLYKLLMLDVASLGYSRLQHLRMVFILGRELIIRGSPTIDANVIRACHRIMLLSYLWSKDHLLIPEGLM